MFQVYATELIEKMGKSDSFLTPFSYGWQICKSLKKEVYARK